MFRQLFSPELRVKKAIYPFFCVFHGCPFQFLGDTPERFVNQLTTD